MSGKDSRVLDGMHGPGVFDHLLCDCHNPFLPLQVLPCTSCFGAQHNGVGCLLALQRSGIMTQPRSLPC
jgi:hypothetical protein